MYRDFSHLCEDDVNNIMRRYYDGESAGKLIKEYRLSITPSNLYRCFPPVVVEQYQCEYCNTPLLSKAPSRRQNSLNITDLYCPICGHHPYLEHCTCKNCSEVELLQQKVQLAQIQNFFSQSNYSVKFDELSFENKVYLGTLCRTLLKENLFEINSLEGSYFKLAPTSNLQNEMYTLLLKAKAITVSHLSPLQAFNFDEENVLNNFDKFKVTYNLNLNFPENKEELFLEILNPKYYSSEFSEEALAIWTKIAVSECIEYLQYQLSKVRFPFMPGEKTYKTFEIILEDFSVSQIYGIIWRCVANASKFYMEKSITKRHAANSVIGNCAKYAERAKINQWELKNYSRIRDLPQSILSVFFFNRVLKIGDMGFELPPTIV